MKKKIIAAISALCLLAAGCGSQKNREAFLEEYIKATDEIVRIVDANPTTAGVKQAQSYLDSQKTSLKSKFAAGKSDSSNPEMQQKFIDVSTEQMTKVFRLSK